MEILGRRIGSQNWPINSIQFVIVDRLLTIPYHAAAISSSNMMLKSIWIMLLFADWPSQATDRCFHKLRLNFPHHCLLRLRVVVIAGNLRKISLALLSAEVKRR